MFCSKCGTEISGDASYCPKCGASQISQRKNNESGRLKYLYAYFVAIATSPVLFVIRMLGQTSEHVSAGTGGAWTSYDRMVVPGNIKAIMFTILICSTIYVCSALFKKAFVNSNKAKITKIMLFFNIIFGIVITLGHY